MERESISATIFDIDGAGASDPGATIRRATARDLPALRRLLAEGGLISTGVREHLGTFVVAARAEELVGAAGLEVYGDAALLRSVVVAPPIQRSGLGSGLVQAALTVARECDVSSVVLLTTAAAPFFARFGFTPVDRTQLDPRLFASAEFSDAACSAATTMQITLREGSA